MTSSSARARPLWAACLLPLLLALPAMAREPSDPPLPAGRLELATERVVVFKDGYALFVKRAEGQVDERGHLYTDEVPDAAVLGTFWATAADGRLLGMRAEWVTEPGVEEEVPCHAVPDLLAANVGRIVTLGTTLPERPVVRGTLEEVLRTPPAGQLVPVHASPLSSRRPGAARIPGAVVTEPPIQLVVLSTGVDERLVLPVGAIQTVSGAGLVTTRMRTRKGARTKRLSFEMGVGAAGEFASLQLLYFRPGLRWIPTYRVGGALVDRAEIALQAEVVNEAEDLDGVPLHLVVGVPNFRFKDVVSPLALESALQGALHSVADNQAILMSQNRLSNSFSNTDSAMSGLAETPGAMHLAPELATQGVQDLFVYEAPPLDLARGARATVPLWTSTAAAAHVYTFERSAERDQAGRRQRSRRGRTSPSHLDRNDVWHQLEMENASATPWTTGAALLLQDGRPVAQEILGYTAPGAKSLLPITVATDIKAVHVEEEVEREARAYRWGDHLFAKITLRGRVTLTSFRTQASAARVRLSLPGRASGLSAGGTLTLDATEGGVNPRSRLAWNLDLQPGETQTLTYELVFYAN